MVDRPVALADFADAANGEDRLIDGGRASRIIGGEGMAEHRGRTHEGRPKIVKLDYLVTGAVTPLSLTLLGKALAHSALKGRANFDAPLEVWVN